LSKKKLVMLRVNRIISGILGYSSKSQNNFITKLGTPQACALPESAHYDDMHLPVSGRNLPSFGSLRLS
jgi:hypothetical protein